MENKMQCYKGVWYMYLPSSDRWVLSETEDTKFGFVCHMNGSMFNAAECFDNYHKWKLESERPDKTYKLYGEYSDLNNRRDSK